MLVFLMGATLVAQPLPDANLQEIEALVAEAVQNVIAADERQKLLEKRAGLCRAALQVEDWPGYVTKRVSADPSLGDTIEIIEDCTFYLHGKLDVLTEQIKADEALLRNGL